MADRDFLRRLPEEDAFERRQALLFKLHIDLPLLVLVLLICGYGLVVLFSAVDQNLDRFTSQIWRLGAALALMMIVAHVPPVTLRRWAVAFYGGGVVLLLVVMFRGTHAHVMTRPSWHGSRSGPVARAFGVGGRPRARPRNPTTRYHS